MTVYRYIAILAGVALFGLFAHAQAKELITGHVVSTDQSAGALIVQLDVENSCGSFTYVASTEVLIDITQAAIDEMAEYDPGALTLKVQGCASGSAVIIGAAGGPDFGDEF